MTREDDVAFERIMQESVAAEANGLMKKQLGRVVEWRDEQRAGGREPSMHDLIVATLRERNKRIHVISAYCAALWKMMEERDGNR